jgi:hypothetical protein
VINVIPEKQKPLNGKGKRMMGKEKERRKRRMNK